MRYVQIETPRSVIEHAVDTLSLHLRKGERVTWLLSGGSAIDLEVRIAQTLQGHDVSRLTIGLIDERFGPVDHKDENYLQLMHANFPMYVSRVLTGSDAQDTTKTFGSFINKALKEADYSLGVFGIGADGHTAGIKPGSPAVANTDVATYYEWDDYKRITITPPTIKRLDEAIIYANGSEKVDTLRTLLHTDAPIQEQPAQILNKVKTSTLYTDNDLS